MRFLLLLFLCTALYADSIVDFLQKNKEQDISEMAFLSCSEENYIQIKQYIEQHIENLYLHHKLIGMAFSLKKQDELLHSYLMDLRKSKMEKQEMQSMALEYFLGYFYARYFQEHKNIQHAWLALYHWNNVLKNHADFLPAWSQAYILLNKIGKNKELMKKCQFQCVRILQNKEINATFFRMPLIDLNNSSISSIKNTQPKEENLWWKERLSMLAWFPVEETKVKQILSWYIKHKQYKQGFEIAKEILNNYYNSYNKKSTIQQEQLIYSYLNQFAYELKYFGLVHEINSIYNFLNSQLNTANESETDENF